MFRTSAHAADTRRFRAVVGVAALATYLLIVAGAVVRVTGSGLGCPDWPTCHSQLIPPPDLAAWIEWTHRTVAAAASALMLASVAATWVWMRTSRATLVVMSLVPVVLAVQVGLGAVVVLLELPAMVVLVHLGFALAILGMLVWAAVAPGKARVGACVRRRAQVLALVAAGLTFSLLLVGGLVRATGAALACPEFPGCGSVAPFAGGPLEALHVGHRLLAVTAGVIVAWLALEVRSLAAATPWLGFALVALVVALVLQASIGALTVLSGQAWYFQALHVAGAAAAWTAMVAVSTLVLRAPAREAHQVGVLVAPASR